MPAEYASGYTADPLKLEQHDTHHSSALVSSVDSYNPGSALPIANFWKSLTKAGLVNFLFTLEWSWIWPVDSTERIPALPTCHVAGPVPGFYGNCCPGRCSMVEFIPMFDNRRLHEMENLSYVPLGILARRRPAMKWFKEVGTVMGELSGVLQQPF